MQELERKFLFIEPTDYLLQLKEYSTKTKHIEQYYILLEKYKEMRVRKTEEGLDTKYELSVKEGNGGMREEIKFTIGEAMYNHMKQKAIGFIEKDRLLFGLDYGLVAEIDFFDDFIITEVEFNNGCQFMEFDEFNFKKLGLTNKFKEVTNDYRYKNSYLATN